MKTDNVKLSRDRLFEKKNEKKIDLYWDSLWVKYLCKAIQDLGSNVGALIYRELGMIIFFYNNVIFYKVMMTAENELIPIEIHKNRAKKVLQMLKEGKINTHVIDQCQEQFKNLNTQSSIKK
jgi:hypothetical protein